MKLIKIGIDVDGVLADFNRPYKALIEKRTSIRLPDISDSYPNTWHYERAAGMSPEDEKRIWAEIHREPGWWAALPALPDAVEFLVWLKNDLNAPHSDIYFITHRAGASAKWQTEIWLREKGFKRPTVLLTGRKGDAASILSLDVYIDDKNENCLDVKEKSPSTTCYMLKQPWNHPVDGVPRLDTLKDFMEILRGKA